MHSDSTFLEGEMARDRGVALFPNFLFPRFLLIFEINYKTDFSIGHADVT